MRPRREPASNRAAVFIAPRIVVSRAVLVPDAASFALDAHADVPRTQIVLPRSPRRPVEARRIAPPMPLSLP